MENLLFTFEICFHYLITDRLQLLNQDLQYSNDFILIKACILEYSCQAIVRFDFNCMISVTIQRHQLYQHYLTSIKWRFGIVFDMRKYQSLLFFVGIKLIGSWRLMMTLMWLLKICGICCNLINQQILFISAVNSNQSSNKDIWVVEQVSLKHFKEYS